MTKIVYNACFGGFGLSTKAMQRYAEIKGWTYKLNGEIGSFQFDQVVNDKGEEISDYDISRTDPALVQVVEELGEEADGWAAKLVICELEPGTRYRIDEYDGNESIETEHDIYWQIA
jgi:hypothetical protein